MANQLNVVGIGGSLRSGSTSLKALAIALEGATAAGARTQLFDVRSLDLPFYNPERQDIPSSAQRLAEAAFHAQGLLWSSPMYHGTVSGSFKNALDWLQLLSGRDPPLLTDRVIGLISAAGGVQGLQAVNTMDFAVRALRAWAVPLVVPIPQAWQAFDDANRPRDPQIEGQLRTLGSEVVRVGARIAAKQVTDFTAECEEAANRAQQATPA